MNIAELRPRYVTIDSSCAYMAVGRSKFYKEFLPRVRTLRIGKRNLVELDSLDALIDNLVSYQEAPEPPHEQRPANL